ncbi:hypothetical protein PMSV_4012 [Photobacterium leiognathi subsp. mandapamensis svers.1.1.]|nr:hypothetical protein PMSV_4012 [Photobacterium leiognathi subsp. mandapamensis svers.1.1.]
MRLILSSIGRRFYVKIGLMASHYGKKIDEKLLNKKSL